ncbi:MAG TPA: type II toxin-antitoxin system RelE/ParE family toxin [Sphingomicrobium sp.]|nr:type II toxin-antitoxin system RelE/ParE family toxin [Sphingomicrobium sp.]
MACTVAFTGEFQAFLDGIRDPVAARAIKTRIVRFEAGLFGDVKSVGGKVMEARINVGAGYRLYYAMRGREMVVLLCGGDKRRQQADIAVAKALAAALGK